jgi:hypothetical protein
MIVAYAGRRAQSLDGDLESVGQRIRRLLAAVQPQAVVGAAADGADTMVLEAALAIPNGPVVHVVLPTTRQVFRTDSVEPGWRDRFEAVLDEITERGGRVETLDLHPGEAAYRLANLVILDRAATLADGEQRAVALVVARQGEGQMIEDLVNRATLRDVPTVRIDPSVDLTAQPKCFVAMPYGKKTDPQRRVELDCDRVYAKVLVPALEHAQLNYRRADEEIDSGLVLEPMIEWLSEADLVIGDLGTANFNVGWELGLRHLMRAGQTVLIGPTGTTPPFDVSAVRHVRYHHDEAGISDDAAIDAWRALAPFLARTGDTTGNDSPVAAVMDVRRWCEVSRRTVADERWEGLRQELALARELRDPEQMLAVLDAAQQSTPEQRRLLRADAGIGLVRLGHFSEAEPLLREIVLADPDVLRPEAHVYYAQSLYRPKGASKGALAEAQRVLRRVLAKRPHHPEVRALLGAVAKRRLQVLQDREARRAELQVALDCYRHDFERNLNLYYEGINVVALGVTLALGYADDVAGAHAHDLLPVVRFAARLALDRPDERYWAAATIAECTLHEHLLAASGDPASVRAAYRDAGALRPPDGYLNSTLVQLDFLDCLGLPAQPIAQAREGLLQGAQRDARQ